MKLSKRFGLAGPFLWTCFLAACKRGNPQGEFFYISEERGVFDLVGVTLATEPLPFTLETFFTYTGQLKQTRKRRSGDLIYIVSTRWGDWQKEIKRELDAERISSKRRESISDIEATNLRQTSDGKATDRDNDKDNDRDSEKRLANILSDLGETDPQRLHRLIAAYPDRDHLGEAVRMVDWSLSKGVERKDVVRAYGNWLAKAKPVNSSEPYYPRLTEPV